MKNFVTALFVLIYAAPVLAQGDTPADKLMNAKNIECQVDPGAGADYSVSGNIEVEGFSFGPGGQFTFTDIDLKAGTASRSGSSDDSKIAVFVNSPGLNFLETQEYSVNLTTVYGRLIDGKYPVVNSRHTTTLTQTLPQQYYGYCQVR